MFPQVAVPSSHKENSTAVMLMAVGLSLLIQGCWTSASQTERGCKKWTSVGQNACCEICHPGNRLVQQCGPDPKDLCTPCEPGTFTKEPQADRCIRCTQCVGAQEVEEACTATTDTKCRCKKGQTCGVEDCSFCVETCGQGQEPTEERSCRPCPNGTFNDQIHQKCKPWRTTCSGQATVVKGDAYTDIKCVTIELVKLYSKESEEWPVALSVVPIVLMAFIIIIIMIIIVAVKNLKKRNKGNEKQEETKKTPIIRTPTDDPRTLIAIECSFHEAQQEQGSSTESLNSKELTASCIKLV